jgi:hypothetical protein
LFISSPVWRLCPPQEVPCLLEYKTYGHFNQKIPAILAEPPFDWEKPAAPPLSLAELLVSHLIISRIGAIRERFRDYQ